MIQLFAACYLNVVKRFQLQTINLNINLVLGPLSPSDAANCRQLLNNLNLNLGGVVVIVVVIFVPGEA